MNETKYVGYIDWFVTSKGNPFGYIKYQGNEKEESIFFHQNQIIQPSLVKINKFIENQVVVFLIRKSPRKKDKLEAYDVILLEDEKNILWLTSQFIKLLANNICTPTRTQFTNFFDKNTIHPLTVKNLIVDGLISIFNENYSNATLIDILKAFPEVINQDQKLCNILLISLLDRLQKNESTLRYIISGLKNHLGKDSPLYKRFIDTVIKLVETSKLQFNKIEDVEFFTGVLKELSLDKAVNSCFDNTDFDTLIKLLQKDNLPFSEKLDKEDYLYILKNTVKNANFNSFISANKQSLIFFKSVEEKGLQSELPSILSTLNESVKLQLWLNDIIDNFNLTSYLSLINQLSSESQQLFVKKLFYYIYSNRLNLNLNDILKLTINDYSTMVVFKLLEIISANYTFNKGSLKYDLLNIVSSTNLINHASDVLQLKGYFNLCSGRVIETHRLPDTPHYKHSNFVREGNLIENRQYYYIRDDYVRINSNRIVCDGQISIKDGNLSLSQGQSAFWWCKNKQCFECARKYSNNTHDWKNYTVLDFLAILGINFNDNDIGLLYGVINHVNKFLEHLNCRNCGKLLKANGSSNYTFYRVSNFSCDNPECLTPDKDVYLSHCSNGFYCDGIIDSRESERCENGFVICTQCFACCDQKRLEQRNNNRLKNQLGEVQWYPPHRGSVILCPKCGNTLTYRDAHDKQVKCTEVIQLLENLYNDGAPQASKLVGNSGVYQNSGLRWFVVYQRHVPRNEFLNTLHYWKSIGFEITDFPKDLTKPHYRVIEPSSSQLAQVTVFNCTQCNITYDYTQDSSRYKAIQHWHFSPLNQV